jgi:predicted membrane-bound mannosyltransferase
LVIQYADAAELVIGGTHETPEWGCPVVSIRQTHWWRRQAAVTLSFALLVLIDIAVKLSRLGSRELWLDETYSALLATMPFTDAARYTIADVHPPLFYVLLWVWVRVVGHSEAALRLFSVSLSAFGLVALIFVVRKWLGTRAAAFSSALFALSPMLYVYSALRRN